MRAWLRTQPINRVADINWLRAWSVLLVALVLLGRPACADDAPRLENMLPVAPPREGGPMLVLGELHWLGPELFEGQLRYALRDGGHVLGVIETDPIAAAPGIMRFRQLLPFEQPTVGYGMSDLHVSFATASKEHFLSEIGVRLPQLGRWESVVLCAEPTPGGGLAGGERIREALSFERLFADPRRFGVQGYSPSLPASDFPEQSLAYCAFDALLLPRDGFARLSGRQLTAIADWTRAGGAVCIDATGPLEAKQLEFLNALFADTDLGALVRQPNGHLIEPVGADEGILVRRAGLGCVALLVSESEGLNLDSARWREAHARFWRLRERCVSLRKNGKTLDELALSQVTPANQYAIDYARRTGIPVGQTPPVHTDPTGWTYPAPSFGSAIVQALRPTELRLLPGWAVVLILFGYAIVVGPVDYWVLGWLRMRRWTWVTFPAVTIAVTWGVVATADAFMSSDDYRRTVEIIDLDARATPVRRTRLELVFRGSTDTILHEFEKEFFTRLSGVHFQEANPFDPMGRPRTHLNTSNDAPTGPYRGTLPSRFVVPQRVGKWTPQVNRTFEINPDVTVPPIDWTSIQSGALLPSTLPNGDTMYCMRITAGVSDGPSGPLGDVTVARATSDMRYSSSLSFLDAATAAENRERFSIQYQRSPLGLGRLDDLPFADKTGSDEIALIAWLQDRSGNITIYRKLARSE